MDVVITLVVLSVALVIIPSSTLEGYSAVTTPVVLAVLPMAVAAIFPVSIALQQRGWGC